MIAPMIKSICVGLPERATSSWFSRKMYAQAITDMTAKSHPVPWLIRSPRVGPSSSPPVRMRLCTPTPKKPRTDINAKWTGRCSSAVNGEIPAAYM